jgi:hypothetical protein
MENKIKKIIEILDGETIFNCFEILSKVLSEVNNKKSELQEILIFKI